VSNYILSQRKVCCSPDCSDEMPLLQDWQFRVPSDRLNNFKPFLQTRAALRTVLRQHQPKEVWSLRARSCTSDSI